MSSDVQAKCTNSLACLSEASSPMRSLMKYSTALTSWLVVASMSLMRAASATEKSAATFCNVVRAAAGKGGNSMMPGSSDNATSHAISTATRRCISPYSLKIGRNASTLDA